MLYEELDEKSYDDFLDSLTIKKVMRVLSLTRDSLTDCFNEFEDHDERVNEIITSMYVYSGTIRRIGGDIINFETKLENIQKGIMGNIWGATLIEKLMPTNVVLIISNSRKVVILKIGTHNFAKYRFISSR